VTTCEKALSMLGLCQRAGKLASGFDAVRLALSKKQAKLVVVSGFSSPDTIDRWRAKCHYYEVAFCVIEADLGHAIGKDGRVVAAVTDEGFARAIAPLCEAK